MLVVVFCPRRLFNPTSYLHLLFSPPVFRYVFKRLVPALCGALAGCILFGVLYMTKWDAAERKVSLASRHEEVQLIKDVIMRRKELHEKVCGDAVHTQPLNLILVICAINFSHTLTHPCSVVC